jgi:tRNA G10  N-methylase Trm11
MFMFRPLNNLISFLDPLVGAVGCGVEITRLGATDLGVEVRAPLAREADTTLTWTSSAP